LWGTGAAWAALAVMATIPAQQAVTNLQSWAELFQLPALANYLSTRAFWDQFTLAAGALNTGITISQFAAKSSDRKRWVWLAIGVQVICLTFGAAFIFGLLSPSMLHP
jgi:thiamine monophosphate synthase